MRGMRSAWAVLVAGSLSLSGCKKEADPGPPPVNDSQADWEDTGRLAACTNVSVLESSCGDDTGFDFSGCDKASLANLPRDGIYTLVYRYDTEPLFVGAGSFRISSDGGLDSFRGEPPTERRMASDAFYLSSTRRTSETVTLRNTLVGCRAEGNRLYGCFANCRNGSLTSGGTFMAVKWEPRAGEAQASGLTLASESFVAQGEPVDVYVTQGHAYVVSLRLGSEGGGLSVFDVSNPSAPVLKKVISLPTDNYWNGVWAKGNALYVASANTGVIVFDISNPAQPQQLRSVPSGQGPVGVHTVFVEGDRLYGMQTKNFIDKQ